MTSEREYQLTCDCLSKIVKGIWNPGIVGAILNKKFPHQN